MTYVTDDMVGKVVELWLDDGRNIMGVLEDVQFYTYKVRCESETVQTVWGVARAHVVAIGMNVDAPHDAS